MITTTIEDGFFELLQSEVVLSIDGKKYRTGRFLNFRIDELFIQLDLIINGKQRHVDIPLPYGCEYTENEVVLSYVLSDMGEYGEAIDAKLKLVIGGGKSKLYNKCLVIRRV